MRLAYPCESCMWTGRVCLCLCSVGEFWNMCNYYSHTNLLRHLDKKLWVCKLFIKKPLGEKFLKENTMNGCLSFKHYRIGLITHDKNANSPPLFLAGEFFLCVHSEFPGFPLVNQYDFYDYQNFNVLLDALFLFFEKSNILIQSEWKLLYMLGTVLNCVCIILLNLYTTI